MTRTSLKSFNCSVAQTLDILGDKWTMMIIRDAFLGVSAFTHFQKRLKIARNILADRLALLVDNEILERRPARPGTRRYEYHLTERGRALFPILTAITQWGDKWIFGSKGEPMLLLDVEKNAPVQQVGVLSRGGSFLNSKDVKFVPGPGAAHGK